MFELSVSSCIWLQLLPWIDKNWPWKSKFPELTSGVIWFHNLWHLTLYPLPLIHHPETPCAESFMHNPQHLVRIFNLSISSCDWLQKSPWIDRMWPWKCRFPQCSPRMLCLHKLWHNDDITLIVIFALSLNFFSQCTCNLTAIPNVLTPNP
jgi:hypothetical protein